jgi:glycosyltransferase involved in cell wall biosynthesis
MSTALAAFILAVWLLAALVVPVGNRRVRRLMQLAAPPPARWPKVSVVIAARNEAATLGAAIPTMLALDYPDLELIAVNDRSDDGTGNLLDDLAQRHPALRVVHVHDLPPGWIGKNHALHLGAAQASGDFVLFTDADIHFAPDTLRRAIAHAEAERLDLLAAVPQLTNQGHLLGICVNAFSFAFTAALLPWRIRNPRSRAFGSVGAFGLVRAAVYRRFGGHERIRLRPDDDIKLGKLFKQNGARCELLHGAGAISVEWYRDVRGMVHGLTKNSYAGADYRIWAPPLGAVLMFGLYLWPWVALAATDGAAWWLSLASVGLMLVLGVDQTRFAGGRWWHGLFLPFGMAVFSYIILRSQWITHRTGGITWRGTHYPLGELKRNVV